MSKSDELKTIVEWVGVKNREIKNEILDAVTTIYNQIKEDPDFRGPVGFAGSDGADGEQGPQGLQGVPGARGAMGPMPRVQVDETSVRFQTGNLINEETGESVAQWSDWIDLRGPQGEKGDIGPQGPAGVMGEQGPIGEAGPKGDRGDSLTWQDLTEAQIQQLRGPQGPQGERGPIGEQGPAGRDGQTPLVESVGTRIRLQTGTVLNESTGITTPQFTDWIDIKGEMGMQGPQGPEGAPGKMPKVQMEGTKFRYQIGNLINEETGEIQPTWSKWVDIQGPQGEQGPIGAQGPIGEQGPQGEPGRDFDDTLFEAAKKDITEQAVKEFQKKVKALRTEMDHLVTNKVNELSAKAETLYNKRNIEMMVPIGAVGGTDSFGYDNSILLQILYQTTASYIDSDGMGHTVVNYAPTGTPVYIDSPSKAAVREVEVPGSPSYNPNMVIGVADNRFSATLADALLLPDPSKKAVLLIRNGVASVDPSIVLPPTYTGANGPEVAEWLAQYKAAGPTDGWYLIPGEYYYLDQHGYITPNIPGDSEGLYVQYIGQAISQTQLYVEIQKFAFNISKVTPIPPVTTPAIYSGAAAIGIVPDNNYVVNNFRTTTTYDPAGTTLTIGGIATAEQYDNRWILIRSDITSEQFIFDWGYYDPVLSVWNSLGNINSDFSTQIQVGSAVYTMYRFGNAFANRVLQLRIMG